MKVYCYNIKYQGKEAIISISGPNALQGFAENGYINFYNNETAPKSLEVDVSLSNNWLDNLIDTEEKIKAVLQEETGLTIQTFNYIVKE